ncbi:MAG: glycine cleavage system aminomethyltransferase GcvT [Notoacmeibacter sp.]
MADETQNPVQTLPLEHLHIGAGAKFGAFAGWNMPLSYPLGVMKEHLHTRSAAGLFDISHMQLVEIEGPDAAGFLTHALPLDPDLMVDRQSKYTFLLNENAGIEDDLIVTRLSSTRFMIIANASRAEADVAELKLRAAQFGVKVTALPRVTLALQGPLAEQALMAAGISNPPQSFMTATEPQPNWFLTRSGYTGEDGFEIAIPLDDAEAFASKLAAQENVEWIGLAARDSLRLEAGLCLHGSDIDSKTNPVSAGLIWAVPKSIRIDGDFVGAKALGKILANGVTHKRVGLKAEGRQPVRGGIALTDEHGAAAGQVTSGGFGPSAEGPVAMGYVRADLAAVGTRVLADLRGKPTPMIVSPLPFIPHTYRKG